MTVTVPCSMPVGTVFEPDGRNAFHDLFRHGGRGDVNLRDRHAEQCVSHRAADDARLLAIAIEHIEKARQLRHLSSQAASPSLRSVRPVLRRHYFVVPGTNLPFSMCAGT